jgi:hypothetical protein
MYSRGNLHVLESTVTAVMPHFSKIKNVGGAVGGTRCFTELCSDHEGGQGVKRETNVNPNHSHGLKKHMPLSKPYKPRVHNPSWLA